MIREENSRMLSQVENILRISQLEKSSNPFDMEDTNIHEVIEDAIEHVKLIVESRKGSIKISLDAAKSIISGNSNHLENIIINILDNAVKYSKKNPHIIISSSNSDGNIIICIQDNGIGMDKNIQNGSVQFFAIFKPLIKIKRKSVKTGTVPITNPSSSPMMAKIKSVCGVGRK